MSIDIPCLGEMPALPSFLTATNKTAPAREEPVYRSVRFPMGGGDQKAPQGLNFGGLGGLSMPGLTQSKSLPSLPGFLTHTGHAMPVFRDQPAMPVFRDLKSQTGGLAPVSSFRAFDDEPTVKPRMLPPVYEQNTSFSCNKPAKEIFRALKISLSPYAVEAKPEKGKLKGNAVVDGRCVVFQVHIFTKPSGDCLVEFQRRRGCSCAFWYLFQDTMETLSKDLADAAAFLNTLPDSGLARKRASLVGKPMRCSSQTLKRFESMASSSYVESQLEALQAVGDVIRNRQESDILERISKMVLKACSSKDKDVACCAKDVLQKLLQQGVKTSEGGLKDKIMDKEQIQTAMATMALKSLRLGGRAKTAPLRFDEVS